DFHVTGVQTCALPISRALLGKQRPPAQAERQGLSDRLTARAVSTLESWNARWVVASRRRAWLWVVAALGVFFLSMLAFSQARVRSEERRGGTECVYGG